MERTENDEKERRERKKGIVKAISNVQKYIHTTDISCRICKPKRKYRKGKKDQLNLL